MKKLSSARFTNAWKPYHTIIILALAVIWVVAPIKTSKSTATPTPTLDKTYGYAPDPYDCARI